MLPLLTPTADLIEQIITRVPEGFLPIATIRKHLPHMPHVAKKVQALMMEGKTAYYNNTIYDLTRVRPANLPAYVRRLHPLFPLMLPDGTFPHPTIQTQQAARTAMITPNSALERIFARLDASEGGYGPREALLAQSSDNFTLQSLLDTQMLFEVEGYIFDPLRLGVQSMYAMKNYDQTQIIKQRILDYLLSKEGETAPRDELYEHFGKEHAQQAFSMGGFSDYPVDLPKQGRMIWIRPRGSDPARAIAVAKEAVAVKDEDWLALYETVGEVLRPGAEEGKSYRKHVHNRSYTTTSAAKRLGIRVRLLERALKQRLFTAFNDPEGSDRIPAYQVEAFITDPARLEDLLALETVKLQEIALFLNVSSDTMRRRLRRANIDTQEPRWGLVRGKWDLPHSFIDFRTQLTPKIEAWRAHRDQVRQEAERAETERIESERRQREALRTRLVAAFPTWRHDGRADQRIFLHVGPPNSGKTHDALKALMTAGTGWYLAPLRLLAFEIFDRLNQQGVLCNLLTGEEYVEVPGATITAATVEMFNPLYSGQCVIVDESQMLADADRGWAWTRALMESQSPEIHVIAPHIARELIERLGQAAAIPVHVIEHQRLCPIQVSDTPWTLSRLPERTILVGFSRQVVLQLKTDLEQQKRSVSVIYGNLPPEVRRKQADRFAQGQTEICIATDAVGMGLNLPADRVCFFEVEKFDGRTVRPLLPTEVQQIGGRAGRFGLATAGEVGATSRRDLEIVRRLFNTPAETLTHARVSPSVEDIEILPGTLTERLVQWSALQSIPDSLRGVIRTADMSERIELARMLNDEQVKQLGLEAALKLINAPTRIRSRPFWLSCAFNILSSKPLPLPPPSPSTVNDEHGLDQLEYCVSCADIYLWLGRRREFGHLADHEPQVRQLRGQWSLMIDEALLARMDTRSHCYECGKMLTTGHRFRICEDCYEKRGGTRDSGRSNGRATANGAARGNRFGRRGWR
jgi:hypothetical protein